MTDTTTSAGVLDSLFGTVDKGFDLWSKWQNTKADLTAKQIQQSSVTDVNKQPDPVRSFALTPQTVAIAAGAAVAVGVLVWALRSK